MTRVRISRQANDAAQTLKQSLLKNGTRVRSVNVGVHLRFTATDDSVLDAAILPTDFGLCMEVSVKANETRLIAIYCPFTRISIVRRQLSR